MSVLERIIQVRPLIKPKKKLTIETKKKIEGSLFILPWFIGLLLFSVYPVIASFILSFQKVKITGVKVTRDFIGLANYKYALLSEPDFQDSMFRNLEEIIIIIPVIVVFSFLVAHLLNQNFKGKGFFRTVFFLPVIFTTGFLIDQLLKQNVGDVSKTLATGTSDIKMLLLENMDKKWADPLISIIDRFIFILWYSGVQILIFLAGLQSIGKQIYDAAKVDGASAWEAFWKITLPGTVPFIFLNTIYTIVNLFTLDWNAIMSYIQANMFKPETGIGYASALGWLYFVMIGILLVPVFLLFNRNRDRKLRI